MVEHEIGHLLGFEHSDAGTFGVMHEDLPAGTRYLLASQSTAPEAQAPSAPPAFDANAAWPYYPSLYYSLMYTNSSK